MKDVRSQMEEDANLRVLMESLRGTNLSNADFADANVEMRLVSVLDEDDEGEGLPLDYDPELIRNYWSRRPVSVVARIIQLLGKYLGQLCIVGLQGVVRGRIGATLTEIT